MGDTKKSYGQTVRPSAPYSEQYRMIRNEAETKWPAWKVSIYNTCFAVSSHARKLNRT